MNKPELIHECGDYRIIKIDGATRHLNLSIKFVLERTLGSDLMGNQRWEKIFGFSDDENNPWVEALMYEVYKLKQEIGRLKTL